ILGGLAGVLFGIAVSKSTDKNSKRHLRRSNGKVEIASYGTDCPRICEFYREKCNRRPIGFVLTASEEDRQIAEIGAKVNNSRLKKARAVAKISVVAFLVA